MGAAERKQMEKEMKQKDIIDAAERVFFSKGFDNSSMDEVAKEAEFSKRTVYLYFNSKEQIYFEIMIRGYKLLIEMLENAFHTECPQTAPEKLRCIFFTFHSFSKKHCAYFRAIMEYETKDCDEKTSVSDASKAECYRLGEQVLQYLSDTLQMGISEGSLKSELDSQKTALILWAYTIGVFNASEKKCEYLKNYRNILSDEFITESFRLAMKLIV